MLRHHPEQVWLGLDDAGLALVADDDLTLVVHPQARGTGVGARLLGQALDAVPTVRTAWSHVDHPAARALAARAGFEAVRSLWVMRRDAAADLPALDLSDGVRVRAYRPEDDAEVLRVNAAAFAHHPEQGSMDAANLAERMAEEWFDPAGLLVAELDGRPGLAGFHWTKRHSPELGEVYVVGVDPDAQGHGLGRLLTLAGLHHLADGGAREVLLYVESDNEPAVKVYSRLGFTHAASDTHVQYARG